MGPERAHDDLDAGSEELPKLTWVGRLHGTLAGRPMEFEADGRSGTLRLSGLACARRARSAWPRVGPVLTRALDHAGLELYGRIGRLPALRIAPRPGLLARILLPGPA
jgi:hypothetical protein